MLRQRTLDSTPRQYASHQHLPSTPPLLLYLGIYDPFGESNLTWCLRTLKSRQRNINSELERLLPPQYEIGPRSLTLVFELSGMQNERKRKVKSEHGLRACYSTRSMMQRLKDRYRWKYQCWDTFKKVTSVRLTGYSLLYFCTVSKTRRDIDLLAERHARNSNLDLHLRSTLTLIHELYFLIFNVMLHDHFILLWE